MTAFRYVAAGLFCVVTIAAAALVSARQQDGAPSQPAQTQVQPATPIEIPLDPQSLGQMVATQPDCFTGVIVPADPSTDKGIVQKPPDRQTAFTMRVVPAPPCVIPGVATGQGAGAISPDGMRWTPLPTNRTPSIWSLPLNGTPGILNSPVVPLAPTPPAGPREQ